MIYIIITYTAVESGIMMAWASIRCCITTDKDGTQAPQYVNQKVPRCQPCLSCT